jgi:hypothetical protein
MKLVLTILFLLTVGAAWADPPMKVIYQKSSSAGFSWYWPYKTWHKTTSTQTHVSGSGSGYRTIVDYPTYDDLSKYRFHNPQRTYLNQWGYFFPAGTRPVRVGSGSALLVPALH